MPNATKPVNYCPGTYGLWANRAVSSHARKMSAVVFNSSMKGKGDKRMKSMYKKRETQEIY